MGSTGCGTLAALCLLSLLEAVLFLQNQLETAISTMSLALPASPGVVFLTQVTFSCGGAERGKKFPRKEQKAPPTPSSWGAGGGGPDTRLAFACNKYLPTGRAALSESFSTLRERVATSLGAVGRGSCGCARRQALSQEAPGKSFPQPHSSDNPARAS